MTAHDAPLDSVRETVGETPLVRVRASPDDVPVYAKLESFNPGASVKDRIGVYMLEAMLDRGDVDPGGSVVEPTAGNTGIGMAIAATRLPLDVTFVVPAEFSVEKQELMRALGAEVVNTPTEDGMPGAIDRAYDIAADRENAVVPEQFSNPLNVEAHYETTAPEVFEALDGEVGAVVAGCGTAGTLMGLARYARERDDGVRVIAVEPEGSLFATTMGRDAEEAEYIVEGIGTHDTSRNELFDPSLVDEVVQVANEDAHAEVQRLAREEGHLVGSSAAAASLAARDVARAAADGSLSLPHDAVATVFPDSSERYLSKDIHGTFAEWRDASQ